MSRVPGFRTNVLWKKIAAIAGYIALLILIAVSFDEPTMLDTVVSLCAGILVFFALFLPVITWRSERRFWPWSRRSVAARIGALIGYLFCCFLLLGGLLSIQSPQKRAAQAAADRIAAKQAAQQQAEAQKTAQQAEEQKQAAAANASAKEAAAKRAAAAKLAAQKSEAQKKAALKAAAAKVAAQKAAHAKAAAQKAAAEKAAQEAEHEAAAQKAAVQAAQNAEANYKGGAQNIGWETLSRNPDQYAGSDVRFTGEVLSVLDNGDGSEVLQLAVAPDSFGGYSADECVLVDWAPEDPNANRILQNDVITVYGLFEGIQNYTTVLGASESAPQLTGKYIDLVGHEGN